jgi:hypothetical protein
MEEIICKIDISKNSLDNVYTFYKNGEVSREYDQSLYSLNKTESVNVTLINERTKDKLLDKCPDNNIDEIKKILSK